MVFGIKFRIYYLLTYKTENLSDWEYDFLNSLSILEDLTPRQYNKLMEVWEVRKMKDRTSKDRDYGDYDPPHDMHEMRAMYGYQF